eukprot:gb/GEZN01001882.1/.p1 GENE.gb/GEZN01001882.1/~~gb/GEZN01001882.1/.p1  ORF type:complete len:869 (+),score=99.93 gb/GEZN01001882.1/:336-2609(+)
MSVFRRSKERLVRFKPWAGTFETDHIIYFPLIDEEIIRIIKFAKSQKKHVRVVGNTHSQSTVVASPQEDVIVMSLEKYNRHKYLFDAAADGDKKKEIPNFKWTKGEQGDATREVQIHAAFSLEQLYKLTVPNGQGYFLASQTAGNGFTIAGVMLNSVHGSTMTAGPLHDDLTGVRYIDHEGKIQNIHEDTDPEKLIEFRCSLGLLGVTTHMQIRLHRRTALKPVHDFTTMKLDPHKLDGKAIEQLVMGSASLPVTVRMHFWDPFRYGVVALRWEPINDAGQKSKFKASTQTPQKGFEDFKSGFTENSAIENVFNTVVLDYSFHSMLVDSSMEVAFRALKIYARQDFETDKDMFLINFAPPCVFMAYFFTLPEVGWGEHLQKILLAVSDSFRKGSLVYRLRCPVEFRFLRSTGKAKFNPLYDPEGPTVNSSEGKLALVIEIIEYSGVLDVTFSESSHKASQMCNEFMEYFYTVEQKWLKLGGKPHYGKLFGIKPRFPERKLHQDGYRSFSACSISEIWPPARKEELRQICKKYDPTGVFMSKFGRSLIEQGPADEDTLERLLDSEDLYIRYDVKTAHFWLITIPYWFAGTCYFLTMVSLWLWLILAKDSPCPGLSTGATRWVWIRGIIALTPVPFHIGILKLRFSNMPGRLRDSVDRGDKVWFRILPLCDIGITIFGSVTLLTMPEFSKACNSIWTKLEWIFMGVLAFVWLYRMQARVFGTYVSTFHYMGDGLMVLQKNWRGKMWPSKVNVGAFRKKL